LLFNTMSRFTLSKLTLHTSKKKKPKTQINQTLKEKRKTVLFK